MNPRASTAWDRLQALCAQSAATTLAERFVRDPRRAERFTVSAAGITLDYSKQRIDEQILGALVDLADASDLDAMRRAMYAGEVINPSEARAAWHVALRAPPDAPLCDEVHAVRRAIAEFAARVRDGRWTGFSGERIRCVVNIGIGGSDLGPRMVCAALSAGDARPRALFVSNVDPADLDAKLARLDPATTLFIVTSKSFATAETLANAHAARAWLVAAGAREADIARHFVAVSTNRAAVAEFGIERMFGFWDWVGGRFSLWSAVGLSIALACGADVFERLLSGAHAMDEHFRRSPAAHNLPVLLALVGVWNRNFLGMPSHVLVPYAQRLGALPAWLQQLEMESNGKAATRDGGDCAVDTAPSVWGSMGTNAQHAYFQMLHQAAPAAAVDFVLPLSEAAAAGDARERQRVANCLAQAEALMCGRDADALTAELAADGWRGDALGRQLAARRFDGNRPSSMLVMDALDAYSLGALLAAYEHKVFVQGVIWHINSFDQWGVELGKTMAGRILAELEDGPGTAHDGSTAALIARVRDRWQR